MSLLQKGSKEKWEVIGIEGVVCHCVVRYRVWAVSCLVGHGVLCGG